MSRSSVAKLAHHSFERVVKVNAREFACFIPFPSELPPHAKATRVYIYIYIFQTKFPHFHMFWKPQLARVFRHVILNYICFGSEGKPGLLCLVSC